MGAGGMCGGLKWRRQVSFRGSTHREAVGSGVKRFSAALLAAFLPRPRWIDFPYLHRKELFSSTQ